MRITARSPCSVFCRHETKIRLVGGKEGGGGYPVYTDPWKARKKKKIFHFQDTQM